MCDADPEGEEELSKSAAAMCDADPEGEEELFFLQIDALGVDELRALCKERGCYPTGAKYKHQYIAALEAAGYPTVHEEDVARLALEDDEHEEEEEEEEDVLDGVYNHEAAMRQAWQVAADAEKEEAECLLSNTPLPPAGGEEEEEEEEEEEDVEKCLLDVDRKVYEGNMRSLFRNDTICPQPALSLAGRRRRIAEEEEEDNGGLTKEASAFFRKCGELERGDLASVRVVLGYEGADMTYDSSTKRFLVTYDSPNQFSPGFWSFGQEDGTIVQKQVP
jgi:hypothetical protein